MPPTIRNHYSYVLFFKREPDQDVAGEARAWLDSTLSDYELVTDIGCDWPTLSKRPIAFRMIDDPKRNYLMPSARSFGNFTSSRPSKPEFRALLRSKYALTIDLGVTQDFAWEPYSQGIELAYQLARRFKALIYDERTGRTFDAESLGSIRFWRDDRLQLHECSDREPPYFAVGHITTQPVSRTGLPGLITVGMRKFAQPEVVIEDFVPGWSQTELVHIVAQHLIEGARPDPLTGALVLDLNAFRSPEARRALLGTRPGALGKANVRLVPVDAAPPSQVLALSFQDSPGETLYQRQLDVLLSLFGIHDADRWNLPLDQSRQVILAIAGARSRLRRLRRLFNEGLPPGERIFVMAADGLVSGQKVGH